MNLQKSIEFYKEAIQYLPAGVNSPVRAFYQVGGNPIYFIKGNGCYLEDVDGNMYIDFCNSWGPLIHGHRHPEVIFAIQEQIQKTLTLGTPHPFEVELAKMIIHKVSKDVPGIEMIRFVNSGTEAVMSAIRLARGHTNRNKIVKFEGCYHGHFDSLLVKAGSGLATFGHPSSAGIPEALAKETVVLPLDDELLVEKTFKKFGDDIAGVIIEPVPANNGLLLQRKEYLEFLRKITTQYGSLLIFDEIISGFRISFSGASGYYNIQPDLITYGKIIGGGMPVGAFAGKREILSKISPLGPVYQAGTLSGNPIAMAAGIAQLRLLTDEVYQDLEEKGKYLEENIIKIFHKKSLNWKIIRIASIFWIYMDEEKPPRRGDQIRKESMNLYARFFHHSLSKGIYLAPSGYEVGFLSVPMGKKEIDHFLEAVDSFHV